MNYICNFFTSKFHPTYKYMHEIDSKISAQNKLYGYIKWFATLSLTESLEVVTKIVVELVQQWKTQAQI